MSPSIPPLPRLVPLFDAHCHLQDERLSDWQRVAVEDKEGDGEETEGGDDEHQDRRRRRRLDAVVAAARSSGVLGVACCACRESDWPLVAALADRYPGFVFASFGLHPWFLSERREGWERRLEALLRERPGAGVGESGLDKAKTTTSNKRTLPPLEEQIEVLKTHARIASELRRPLTVHCVRAAAALSEALSPFAPFLKKSSTSSSSSPSLPSPVSLNNTSLVVHGWNGAAEGAKRLMCLGGGVFFSLGSRSVLRPRKRRVGQKKASPAGKNDEDVGKNDEDDGKNDEDDGEDGTSDSSGFLSHIPLDRLLIETDSPDGYSPLFGPGIEVAVAVRESFSPSSPSLPPSSPPPSSSSSSSFLNQPATLLALLPRVAEALGASEEEVARASYENARGVFCVEDIDEGNG